MDLILKENWGGLLEVLTKEVSEPENQPENIQQYIRLLKRLEDAKTLSQIKRCFCICENDANTLIRERNLITEELIQPIESKESLGLTEYDINYLNSPLLDQIYKVVSSACIPYDKLAQKGYDNALLFFLKRVPIDNYYTAMQFAIECDNLHMVTVLLGQHNYQPVIDGILSTIRSSTKVYYNPDLMQKLANYYTLNQYNFLWACENNDMKYIQAVEKNLDREVFVRAFHTSISCDNFELLNYFLEKMVIPDEIRPQNRRQIIASALESHGIGTLVCKSTRMINRLLDLAEEVGYRYGSVQDAFLLACEKQDIPTINRLIPFGITSLYRVKALYTACLNDYPNTILRLLELDITLPNNNDTILELASRQGYENIIRQLVTRNLICNADNSFLTSVRKGFESIVLILFSYTSLKAKNNAFIEAVQRDYVSIAKFLLQNCLLSKDTIDTASETAAKNGNSETVELFQETITFSTLCKYSHLHLIKDKILTDEMKYEGIKEAVKNEQIHILQFLLGYPKEIPNRFMIQPLEEVNEEPNILDANANVGAELRIGARTGAIRGEDPDIVRAIRRSFIRVSILESNEKEILKYAIENCSAQILQILLEHVTIDKTCRESILKCTNSETLNLALFFVSFNTEDEIEFLHSLYKKNLQENNLEIMKVLLDHAQPENLDKYIIENMKMALLFRQRGIRNSYISSLFNTYNIV